MTNAHESLLIWIAEWIGKIGKHFHSVYFQLVNREAMIKTGNHHLQTSNLFQARIVISAKISGQNYHEKQGVYSLKKPINDQIFPTDQS